jgi:hypothetical protein
MPSLVIESFGMSALESIAEWVPVIWSKIWGLAQFVEDNYDSTSKPLYDILKECISTFSLEKRKQESYEAEEKAKQYTKKHRLKIVEEHARVDKATIISDYTSKIWWIESIIYNSKKALESEWASVQLLWWRIKKNESQGIKRKLWLIATAFNLPLFAHIHNEIREKKPTLVWLHSVSRFLWRLPIAWIPLRKKSQIRCTIHDLGMLHPFGAGVTNLDMIPEFSLAWFTGMTTNIIKKFLIALKFANIRMVKKQLERKVNLRTVPSTFMVDILHQKRGIPKEKILALPHFIA